MDAVILTDTDRIKLPKLRSSVTVSTTGEGGTMGPSDAGFEKIELPVCK